MAPSVRELSVGREAGNRLREAAKERQALWKLWQRKSWLCEPWLCKSWLCKPPQRKPSIAQR